MSFISTALNEEKTVAPFLESLLRQSKLPHEVVIVDGGSWDNTVSTAKAFQQRFIKKKVQFKVFTKRGNRSVGRNEAIRRSGGDIIACSDVGCILHKEWLKRITQPFANSNADIVSGFYLPITKNVFEKCLATYTCVMPDRVDPKNFLPSSRSVAFRKEVWKAVGGYAPHLDTCEDLVFAKTLKENDFRFTFKKNAIVYWPQKGTIVAAFLQFFSYAKGDGMARYVRKQTPFLFGRFAFLLLLLILYFIFNKRQMLYLLTALMVLYLFLAFRKNFRYVRSWEALILLPILQVVSDAAVLLGMTTGLVKSLRR